MCATIIHCEMRAVKEGRFVACALHVVHPEGARDLSELRMRSVLPIIVPQHPRQVFIMILEPNRLANISLIPLFLANLQTTRAFCAS